MRDDMYYEVIDDMYYMLWARPTDAIMRHELKKAISKCMYNSLGDIAISDMRDNMTSLTNLFYASTQQKEVLESRRKT
jgi:hypothetical protein